VFVDITQFVQLPESVVAVGIPSLVRLKVFNDGNGVRRHLPSEPSDPPPCFWGIFPRNRKRGVPSGRGGSEQRQLPRELVQPRAQVVDNIPETEMDILVHPVKLAPDDIAPHLQRRLVS
jgi:hypothetical protein